MWGCLLFTAAVWYKNLVFETAGADQTLEAELFNSFALFLRWLKNI